MGRAREKAMHIAVVAEQGMRWHMEDRHVVRETPEGLFVGVYDGHCGAGAAEYAARMLHTAFLGRLREGVGAGTAFTQVYPEISRDLAYQDAGATAVTCWVCPGRVVCANAGDARAIIVGRGGWRQLSVDHRVEDAEERARVLARGYDLDERERKIEATGLLAVALQHEIDHLDGILFIDRISRLKRGIAQRKMRKLIREAQASAEKDYTLF